MRFDQFVRREVLPYDLFGDPTVADAILGRVVYRAHAIKLKGESMRKLVHLCFGVLKTRHPYQADYAKVS